MRLAVEGRIDALGPDERRLLLERRPVEEAGTEAVAAELIADVRQRGDRALLEAAHRFDGVSLTSVEVSRDRCVDALSDLDPEVRQALRVSIDNVRRFHSAQVPSGLSLTTQEGVTLSWRPIPLARAGVYAPGGRASYPSSVIMGVVPAKAAGVDEVIVCSPPGPDGAPPNAVLAAAELSGADRVFAVGGAGAVAAMAYGTETVEAVDVIVGPGNRWVTEAKRQVAGAVRTDSPAGPSEVLILADDTAPAELVAAELVAQAEHDPEASVALVTWSEALLESAREALEAAVHESPRRDIVTAALAARGALLLAADPSEANTFSRAYAAEHLAVYTADAERDAEANTTAGTVFVGPASSVVFGDYATGANHVLPTNGLARCYSGLSALDFLRFQSVQRLTPAAAAALAPIVELLATKEGLPGHAAAAALRRQP